MALERRDAPELRTFTSRRAHVTAHNAHCNCNHLAHGCLNHWPGVAKHACDLLSAYRLLLTPLYHPNCHTQPWYVSSLLMRSFNRGIFFRRDVPVPQQYGDYAR